MEEGNVTSSMEEESTEEEEENTAPSEPVKPHLEREPPQRPLSATSSRHGPELQIPVLTPIHRSPVAMVTSHSQQHTTPEKAESEESQRDSHQEEDDCDEEQRRAKLAGSSGRGVTLSMLMDDGLIEPGENFMSIDYLGRNFVGDLLPDGRIVSEEQTFSSPSAWAIHCKKVVNPSKKSGCGWASVKYKGKKLDSWKSIWIHGQNPPPLLTQSPGHSSCSPRSLDDNHFDLSHSLRQAGITHNPQPPPPDEEQNGPLDLSMPTSSGPGSYSSSHMMSGLSHSSFANYLSSQYSHHSNQHGHHSNQLSHHSNQHSASPHKSNYKPSVRYATIRCRSSDQDLNTTIDPIPFRSLGKIQPFTISLSTNCTLLMDFHCSITTSEVVGYLGGKWDANTQHLSILQAFPCACRLGDQENAKNIEEEIQRSMNRAGLLLVGWYHSHPLSPPDPSLRDIDAQMEYQLKLKGHGNSYLPCVGLILSPYTGNDGRVETSVSAYWVMPPPENKPLEYGMPMKMEFDVSPDPYVSQDTYTDMKQVMDFYHDAPDIIRFRDTWQQGYNYVEKIKTSLAKKFHKEAVDSQFLEYVHNLLRCAQP